MPPLGTPRRGDGRQGRVAVWYRCPRPFATGAPISGQKCMNPKRPVDEISGLDYLGGARWLWGIVFHPAAVLQSFGQVAQLVEQRTENPRVGGSNPSLATTFLLVWFAAGCGQDTCDELCNEMSWRLSACVRDWPEDWSAVGARGRTNFRRACQNQWADERSQLESWELDDALDQCSETSTALRRSDDRGTACDELRALYLGP